MSSGFQNREYTLEVREGPTNSREIYSADSLAEMREFIEAKEGKR